MALRAFARWMLPAWLVLLVPMANAACTEQDVAAIVARTQEADAAMRAGSLERYLQLMRSSSAKAPADCRPVLDRLQPMVTRCTAEERRVALEAFGAMIGAAGRNDWRGMLAGYEALEQAVTPRCWIATNQRTEIDVVANCSPAELEGLASLAGPMIRATGRAVDSGDVSGLLQVLGAMPAFTPQCGAAIQRHAPPTSGPAGSPPRPRAPGGVNDHGNGLYSVPGVGACGPSGCVAF